MMVPFGLCVLMYLIFFLNCLNMMTTMRIHIQTHTVNTAQQMIIKSCMETKKPFRYLPKFSLSTLWLYSTFTFKVLLSPVVQLAGSQIRYSARWSCSHFLHPCMNTGKRCCTFCMQLHNDHALHRISNGAQARNSYLSPLHRAV